MIDGVCIITGFLGFVACKYKRIEQWQKSFAGKNHWLFKFLRVKLIIQLAPVWCVSLLRTMCFLRSVFHECFPYRAMWLQRSVQVGHVSVLIQSVGHVGHAFYTEWAVCFIQSVGHVFCQYQSVGHVFYTAECGPCILYRVQYMRLFNTECGPCVFYRVWAVCFTQCGPYVFYRVWAICFIQSVGHMFSTECRPYALYRVSRHMFHTKCGPCVLYICRFTRSVGHMFHTMRVWATCFIHMPVLHRVWAICFTQSQCGQSVVHMLLIRVCQ